MANYVRWNPFREMAAMQSALDRMFEDSWRTTPAFRGDTLAFDVYETDTEYTASVALPGLNPDEISIRLEDNVLTISAELPQPQVPEGAHVLVQERSFGTFSRSIRLPGLVDADHVEAHYEDGILTLTLPKAEEAQPKRIPVKAGGKLLQSSN